LQHLGELAGNESTRPCHTPVGGVRKVCSAVIAIQADSVSKGEFINKTTPSSDGAELVYEQLSTGSVCDLFYVAFILVF
jgi:hypothetical protein